MIKLDNNCLYDTGESHIETCKGQCSYGWQGLHNNDVIDEMDQLGDMVENGVSFSGFVGTYGFCRMY